MDPIGNVMRRYQQSHVVPALCISWEVVMIWSQQPPGADVGQPPGAAPLDHKCRSAGRFVLVLSSLVRSVTLTFLLIASRQRLQSWRLMWGNLPALRHLIRSAAAPGGLF